MKACDVRVGQLIKTEWGLATVMKFFAPGYIGCVIINPFPYVKSKHFQPGSWIYLRGLDLEQAEIISESR